MAEDREVRHKRETKLFHCVDCPDTFLAPINARRERCPECRKKKQREWTRAGVAKLRERRQGVPVTVSGAEESTTVKAFRVSCGHDVYLRLAPQDGEDLYCHRCQEWQEYIEGVRRPLCWAKIHRLTPFTTRTDEITGRKYCKRCAEVR